MFSKLEEDALLGSYTQKQEPGKQLRDDQVKFPALTFDTDINKLIGTDFRDVVEMPPLYKRVAFIEGNQPPLGYKTITKCSSAQDWVVYLLKQMSDFAWLVPHTKNDPLIMSALSDSDAKCFMDAKFGKQNITDRINADRARPTMNLEGQKDPQKLMILANTFLQHEEVTKQFESQMSDKLKHLIPRWNWSAYCIGSQLTKKLSEKDQMATGKLITAISAQILNRQQSVLTQVPQSVNDIAWTLDPTKSFFTSSTLGISVKDNPRQVKFTEHVNFLTLAFKGKEWQKELGGNQRLQGEQFVYVNIDNSASDGLNYVALGMSAATARSILKNLIFFCVQSYVYGMTRMTRFDQMILLDKQRQEKNASCKYNYL